MRAILGFAFTILVSQSALAGIYSVTLREFGFNRANCTDDIAVVAQSFAGDAQVAILSSGCVPPEIGDAFPSGKFTYAATSWVETITSDIRKGWGIDGYYASIAECESARQFEHRIFSRLTELPPYVGYCYKANIIGAPRYRVRLDAVGKSTVKKHSMSASWLNKVENEGELVSHVESMVTSIGGKVIAAMIDRDISGHQVAIDYYHEKEFYLHSQELLYWPSTELCQASADSMNQQWVSESSKGVFHCAATTGGTSRLLQIYLSENIFGGFDFDTEIYAAAYPSQSACVSDISRIRTALVQSGMTVFGVTCGQENTLQSWRLVSFSLTE